MKESPDQKTLLEKLKPSKLSAEGYLGSDTRSPVEIIQEDSAVLTRLGSSPESLAARMNHLTAAGLSGLGRPVLVGGLEVTVNDDRGKIPCPFGDAFNAEKRITVVRRIADSKTIFWSDLNIHMIEKHGFFEGRGTWFRVEPDELFDMIGDGTDGSEAPDQEG